MLLVINGEEIISIGTSKKLFGGEERELYGCSIFKMCMYEW